MNMNPVYTLDVGGSIRCSGSLVKSSGSFDIPHPKPPDAHLPPEQRKKHRLRHYFVESNTQGSNLYRYHMQMSKGENEIALPHYFDALNQDAHAWVSPYRHYGQAWAEVEGTTCFVHTKVSGVYNVLIMADRKDPQALGEDWQEHGIEYIEPDTPPPSPPASPRAQSAAAAPPSSGD